MALLTKLYLKKKKSINLTSKEEFNFIHLLSGLLKNGFTVQESLSFMEKSAVFSKKTIQFLIHLMEQGESFDRAVSFLGFNPLIITQIELAQKHGNLSHTLEKIEQHMKLVKKQKENFYKVISYPILLLLFLMIVLISIRQFLLPQLLVTNMVEKSNLGIQFIQKGPYYMLALFLISSCFYLFAKKILSKRNAFKRANVLTKLPVLGPLYSVYYSAFFALEWGKLFSQGLEIRKVIQLMSESNELSLMREVAIFAEKKALAGEEFHEQLKTLSFFVPELMIIIEQGEVKGNLGRELMIFSEICFQRFFLRIDRIIRLIQPLIFLIVAILVVSVYAAMLMPIYGGMENFL